MPNFTLEPDNRSALSALLHDDKWIVACLCAAWCDVCKSYKPSFEQLATTHPDAHFLWIDIEDNADLVGDFDVENFPTLLIQRNNLVAFFGTVLPDTRIAERLLMAQMEKSDAVLAAEASSTTEHQDWQHNYNLRSYLSQKD
jgi:thioredoxin 1